MGDGDNKMAARQILDRSAVVGSQEILLRHHENMTSGDHSSMQYTRTNGMSWTSANAQINCARRGEDKDADDAVATDDDDGVDVEDNVDGVVGLLMKRDDVVVKAIGNEEDW